MAQVELKTPRRSRRLSGLTAEVSLEETLTSVKKRPRTLSTVEDMKENEDAYLKLRSGKKAYRMNGKMNKGISKEVIKAKPVLAVSAKKTKTFESTEPKIKYTWLFATLRLAIFAFLLAIICVVFEFYSEKKYKYEFEPISYDIQLSSLLTKVLEQSAALNTKLQIALNTTDFAGRVETVLENFIH